MADGLYDERPRLYDAVQPEWDYDRDVDFILDALADRGVKPDRLLEVGCGTGEHTRRLAARGADLTAIDVHEGMLRLAREKCTADNGDGSVAFRHTGLPDPTLGDRTPFDAAVAVRGVVNHLPPTDIAPALSALRDCLRPGGVLVFDNSPLPPAGNRPGLDVGRDADGAVAYVRVARHVPTADGRLDWRSVTVTPDGDPFTDSRRMTPFPDDRIAAVLADRGFDVDRAAGYGPGDDRTVFVAVR